MAYDGFVELKILMIQLTKLSKQELRPTYTLFNVKEPKENASMVFGRQMSD